MQYDIHTLFCPYLNKGLSPCSMKRKYPFLRKWIDLTEQWNILLREVMESASLDTLKKHLEMVLGNLLEVSLLEQSGWATWSPEVPANLL